MDKLPKISFFACLSFCFFSCSIDEAKPLVHQKLIIASDFLQKKDVGLFRGFSKENHVEVEIHTMTADSIVKYLSKYGYNANIDIVFVRSLIGIKALKGQNFQEIDESFMIEQGIRLKKIQANWLLAGIDPFVISYLPDSLAKPRTYRELSSDYIWTSPNVSSIDVLKAQMQFELQANAQKDKKALSYKEWNQGLNAHLVNYDEGGVVVSQQLLLVKYSDFLSNNKLMNAKKRKIIFPDHLYYDFLGFSIVPQAKHYHLAKLFIKYWDTNAKHATFLRKFSIWSSDSYSTKKVQFIAPEKILALL